jgi:hypothetical protein
MFSASIVSLWCSVIPGGAIAASAGPVPAESSRLAAAATFEAAGVADRADAFAGSFFESVPEGGDAYIMRAVLHDWDDSDCVRILHVVASAMAPDARLLVIERIVAPPNEGAEAKLSDLNMLVSPGGRERTHDEFASLFEAAGLRLERVVETAGTHAVIEAARA